MHPKASIPLSILIIGGGIGGLAASILLAQSGHSVIVLERKDASFETRSTGGIALFRNSVAIWEAMGLKEELAGIADTGDEIVNFHYGAGEVAVAIPKRHPHSMVHRASALDVLYQKAVKEGVDVRFKVHIVSIQDSKDQPGVTLEDGSEMRADFIIGADGIESFTRRTIMPNITPRPTSSTVNLVNVPLSIMQSHPSTSALYQRPAFHHFLGLGRSIVSWTMTNREIYHLQFCDYESEIPPPNSPSSSTSSYITTMTDSTAFRTRYADFAPEIQHILASTTTYTQWRIAELPPLTTCASATQRIVLLGDAAHAIQPFAGQGANMAIEDGATLATLLSLVEEKGEVGDAVEVYDKLRIPRLAGMREVIRMNRRLFGLGEGEERETRDKWWVGKAAGMGRGMEKENEGNGGVFGGVEEGGLDIVKKVRGFGMHEREMWIDGYDAAEEARKAWGVLKAEREDGEKGVKAKI